MEKERKIPNIKSEKHTYDVRVRLKNNRGYFGPGAARLLELIKEKENVREACSKMDMSYSKGWKILKLIKEDTGFDAVCCKPGGIKGGKTILTTKGESLLLGYRAFEKDVKNFASKRFNFYLDGEKNDN